VKSLSIEDTFQWTQRFVAREWKLLLPVAFAFIAVPQLAFNLLIPPALAEAIAKGNFQLVTQSLQATPWLLLGGILVQLFGLAGALSIAALALVPRISVREAIGVALQRLFVLVAVFILFFFASAVAIMVIAGGLQLLRLNPLTQNTLLLGIVFGLVAVLWMRLIVLAAVIVASRAGPIAAIRLAWDLTTGAFWRILGCMLIYGIGAQVVVLASTFAIGTILVLACSAVGIPALGPLLSLVYVSLINAVFWAGFHTLAVAIYRQLGGSIRGV
jgi:hypothetical protein